jgi:hypothetical protein
LKKGSKVKNNNTTEPKLLFWTVAGPLAILAVVVGGVGVGLSLVLAWLLSRGSKGRCAVPVDTSAYPAGDGLSRILGKDRRRCRLRTAERK